MNNYMFKTKNIRVMWYTKNFGAGDKKDANLYIKDIPQSATHEELLTKFSEYGKISSCSLPMDNTGNSHRGFGYIQYESSEQAKAAIDALHETEWKGTKIFVSILIPQSERSAGQIIKNNLYITGFNENMTELKLKELFQQYGDVTSVSIPDKANHKGYVCFKSQEQAEVALNALNNTTPAGSFGTLTIVFHQKKNTASMKEQ